MTLEEVLVKIRQAEEEKWEELELTDILELPALKQSPF